MIVSYIMGDYIVYIYQMWKNVQYLQKKKENAEKKEWYLSKSNSGIIRKEISLEDAVRDEKGKIKVYEYWMGEKGKL